MAREGKRQAGPVGEVAASVHAVARQDCSGSVGDPNGQADMEIRNIGLQLLMRNSGRIENGPAVLGTPNAGADHAPSVHEIEGEVVNILPGTLAGLTDYERRTLLIHLLDEARQRYDAVRSNRRGLMVLARDFGMSCRDIGTVLGISEQSARAQIKRAKGGGA